MFKSGVFTAKDDLLHLQVVFQGKRKGYICMLNCNAGFQGPRYLSFYDGSQMTVVTNRFDLEVLYRQFESFRKECGLEKPKEVWKYILEFTDTELFNEHNRINF